MKQIISLTSNVLTVSLTEFSEFKMDVKISYDYLRTFTTILIKNSNRPIHIDIKRNIYGFISVNIDVNNRLGISHEFEPLAENEYIVNVAYQMLIRVYDDYRKGKRGHIIY